MSEEHNRFLDELGAYLVGGLEPEEASAVRRHLEGCPDCRAELRDLDGLNELMEAAALTETPPPGLEDRVVAAIEGQAVEARNRRGLAAIDSAMPRLGSPESSRKRVNFGSLAMAAVFFFVLGVGVTLILNPSNTPTQENGNGQVSSASPTPSSLPPLKLLSSDSALSAPTGGELTPVASGDSWQCHITVWGLERGQLYEVWVRDGRNWISAGTFKVRSLDHHDFRVTTGASVKSSARVMVTIETGDDRSGPSERVILTSDATR